ncbi:MAG: hypothetical protein FWD73_14945 [Polyangiaceae bacterium]|nr:hypothetical protein [Polyangiaceae bacterium]
MRARLLASSILAIVCAPTAQAAAQTEPMAPAPERSPPTGEPKPPPYSMPWSLRGAKAATFVRLDAAIAMHDHGVSVPTVLSAGYKIVPDLAVLAKVSYLYDAIKNAENVSAFYNPVFALMYTPSLGEGMRLPIFVGTNIPMGSGGGPTKSKEYISAGNAVYSRSAFDNALFGVTFVTPMAGVGFAYIQHGLTLQVEGTIVFLKRTRGSAYELDNTRWNSSGAAHVGYAILPALTASVELRYQRWLGSNQTTTADPAKQDQLTGAIGLRTKIAFSDTVVARPGVAYIRPLDKPMSVGLLPADNPNRAPFNIIFVDFPVAF